MCECVCSGDQYIHEGVFATRNRNPLCQRKICEFEEMRAIQGLRVEMDFTGETRCGRGRQSVWLLACDFGLLPFPHSEFLICPIRKGCRDSGQCVQALGVQWAWVPTGRAAGEAASPRDRLCVGEQALLP